ncbi:asparagine synthase (glutamine-hydrolyzing) [Synechococcus sp. AH-551-A10]|nr:asparagine synthase (glutamine-hydrolyzing) [Synechococcus sp. AH-551-A10]MDB4682084.1 asparagine synthase (glutamine-hydrolyzing) [Synechococcus sp. AH-551-A10]
MCGIAGLLLTGKEQPSSFDPQKIIHKMVNRISHRGPEAVNIKKYHGGICYLGHSRLRINDDRVIADQPFSSNNDKWKLVFNGEIYNYLDLEMQLKQQGWAPRTKCDTERLVETINNHEINSLSLIDGMFAIGAYNTISKSLFIARDRYGQKPIYYVHENGIFAFASEISSLMELNKWINMKVDKEEMVKYFTLRSIPAPNSGIYPIKKLEAGQYLIVKKDGRVYKDRYFKPTKEGSICSDFPGTKQTFEKVRKGGAYVIDQELKKSITTTVPNRAGIIISGGIDSTLVAASVKEIDNENGRSESRNSYTVKLQNQPSQDFVWAKNLATSWGWRHKEIVLEDRHLVNAYERKSSDLNEPIGDRSLLPTWCLAQSIQLDEKVAIGGDGADEIFLGYERYGKTAKILSNNQDVNWAKNYWEKVLKVGESDAIEKANRKLNIDPMLMLYEKLIILQEEYKEDALSFIQILDILYYLPSVLGKVDQSTMYWGLELRSPMLNTRLTLAAMMLSNEQLNNEEGSKKILRKILEQKTNTSQTKQKLGFGAQIQEGSILQKYFYAKLNHKIRFLKKHDGSNGIFKWLTIYIKETKNWTQNSIFTLCLWLDWLETIDETFPGIEI